MKPAPKDKTCSTCRRYDARDQVCKLENVKMTPTSWCNHGWRKKKWANTKASA